jgi:PAS domain S-box-containing protein
MPAPATDAASNADTAPQALSALAHAVLDQVPAPLLRLAANGQVWANTAARGQLGNGNGDGVIALLQDWLATPAVAVALLQPSACEAELPMPPGTPVAWVRASSQPDDAGGWTIALQAIDEQRALRSQLTQLGEMLELARDFGRLGLWERDARTLQGRWDSRIFGFRGLPDGGRTPSFEESLVNIAVADREIVNTSFRASLRQAGRYEQRFRLVGPDGTLRRVHSQWVVMNGADDQPERAVGLLLDDSEPLALAPSATEPESQLALAVDLGRILLWRHDLASDRVHFNRQGWEALELQARPDGVPLDQVRAKTHSDDLPRVLAATQRALDGGQPVDIESRYQRSDGGWRVLMTRRVVQRDADGHAVALMGVAMDITDRAAQGRRALEVAQRFDAITRTAGIGHWHFDRSSMRTEWSEQLRSLYGLQAQEPTPQGNAWIDGWVHAEDRERLRQATAAWLASRTQTMDIGFRILQRDGRQRHLFALSRRELSESGPQTFGVVIDVTERHRAEQALRSTAERAALAAHSAGLGTWEMDLRDGSTHWDDQMWLLRGRPPEPRAMTADERLACVHPDDRDAMRTLQERTISQQPSAETAFRVIWPDGRVRWLATRSQVLVDEHGQPLRHIGVNWDITDARTAEAVRQEREIARRESAAKSQFMARMSHELRTPLNAVLGFTQLLLTEDTGDDAPAMSRRRRLDHIQSAGSHLLTLINDVLDLASLDSGELRIALQPVDLAPLVQATVPMLGPLVEAHEVAIHTETLTGQAMADATRLRQVLLNLLSNAVKYNRPGGQVWVTTRREAEQVVLTVADNGRGMDEAQMRQLFEPFNRLGMAGATIEGSGIGLTIAKNLAERMGGSLQARSTPGLGSVFELRLQRASAAGHTASALASDTRTMPVAELPQPTVPELPRRQLLYIEDNPVNAMIINELLARRPDLELSIAVDGAAGVQRAQELLPDLILLDMQLPDIDGLEVMRLLQADVRTAHIPCIALSANAMPEDIERALQGGAADYWTKPLDFRAFMAGLDVLFGKPAP